jgi:hypothetical protein
MDMTLLVALLTVVMSGVVAAVVSYLLNTGKEQAFFMRRKGEELYLAAEAYERNLAKHFLPGYAVVKGEMSWNDYLDLEIKNADKNDKEASLQVLMLIDIYFPQLQTEFKKYSDQRDLLNKILNDHKRAYKAGNVGREFFRPFHEAMIQLDTRGKELKQAIITEARKCANSRVLSPWTLKK